MKKMTVFLMFNLLLAASLPMTTRAGYGHDMVQAVGTTVHYAVLRTSEACRDSGSYIKDKIKGMSDSIRLWWADHFKSGDKVIVIKE